MAETVILREQTKIVKKVEIMIIHEKPWHSVLTDTYTLAMVLVATGVGIYFGSSALQWGGLFGLVVMGIVKMSKNDHMTIEQARDKLDSLELEFMKKQKPIDPMGLKKVV
jgi:hypothetical protein